MKKIHVLHALRTFLLLLLLICYNGNANIRFNRRENTRQTRVFRLDRHDRAPRVTLFLRFYPIKASFARERTLFY
jgi:hypothetical protein